MPSGGHGFHLGTPAHVSETALPLQKILSVALAGAGDGRPRRLFRAAHGMRPPSGVLPHPDGFPDTPVPTKIVWNGVGYELHVAIPQPDATPVAGNNRANGPGTDPPGGHHHQAMGKIQKKKVRCQKGSRRCRKLAQAPRRDAVRSERRVRDLRHQGTRLVIAFGQAHGVTTRYGGDPHGVRQDSRGRHRTSGWPNGLQPRYILPIRVKWLAYCASRARSGEPPAGGQRQKPRGRVWRCQRCGFTGHRDLVEPPTCIPSPGANRSRSPRSARPRIDDPASEISGARRPMESPPGEVVTAPGHGPLSCDGVAASEPCESKVGSAPRPHGDGGIRLRGRSSRRIEAYCMDTADDPTGRHDR